MELAFIASLAFFFAIGINVFWPHRVLAIIYGIAAILLGILALVGAGTLNL